MNYEIVKIVSVKSGKKMKNANNCIMCAEVIENLKKGTLK